MASLRVGGGNGGSYTLGAAMAAATAAAVGTTGLRASSAVTGWADIAGTACTPGMPGMAVIVLGGGKAYWNWGYCCSCW